MQNTRNLILRKHFVFTDSLENRIAHYAKKRRIEIISKDELNARKADLTSDGNE